MYNSQVCLGGDRFAISVRGDSKEKGAELNFCTNMSVGSSDPGTVNGGALLICLSTPPSPPSNLPDAARSCRVLT